MKFLISEYNRSQHAESSKEHILTNPLLPIRLDSLRSTIVASHSYSFEDVLSKLPKIAKGLELDDCHPRFISFLLRLGDLLDIDNNRISNETFQNLKSILPSDSLNNFSKHRSIKHLRIDQDKIEITAEIDGGVNREETYEVAEITQKWFDYINEEVTKQTLIWEDVKPKGFTGNLPTLGALIVELKGYEQIDGKNKPEFKVDPKEMLRLMMGTSIYSDKIDALREILQNAIDATLLRVFLEGEKNGKIDEYRSLNTLNARRNIFEGKEIEVKIKNLGDDPDDDPGEVNQWQIDIIDKGIGIDRESVKYLTTVGSSINNNKKSSIIERMPNWMKPSGNFGIGFQSIFMLTDEVRIKSKSLTTGKSLDIELFSPNSEKQGKILYKSTTYDFFEEVGTTISFIYKTKKISTSVKNNGENSFKMKILKNYDPLTSNYFDNQLLDLFDTIKDVYAASIINILLFENEEEHLLEWKDMNKELFQIPNSKFEFFLSDQPGANRLYFKNQLLNNERISILPNYIEHFANVSINFIGYTAREILKLDRNSLQEGIRENINQNLQEDFLKVLKLNEDRIMKNYARTLPAIGFFCKFNDFYINGFSNEFLNAYESFEFEKGVTISKIIKKDNFIIKETKNPYRELEITYANHTKNLDNLLFEMLLTLAVHKNFQAEILSFKPYEIKFVKPKKSDKVKKPSLNFNLKDMISRISKNPSSFLRGKRFFIPIHSDFPKLIINILKVNEAKIYNWISSEHLFLSNFSMLPFSKGLMLFPFLRGWKDVEASSNKKPETQRVPCFFINDVMEEKYIEFQYKFRKDEELSKDDIEKECKKFIKKLKDICASQGISIEEA